MNETEATAKAARRTGIVLAAMALSAIALAALWVIPEMKRVARNRDARLGEARTGSDMIRVTGGRFTMGANDGAPEERPLHDVQVGDFFLDRTEVTNAEFAKFIEATGHITTAELPRSDGGAAGSWCFRAAAGANVADRRAWMAFVPGAHWRKPGGQGTDIEGRGRHPVVHISHDDAVAYCKWAGKRLPTEAEWEYAARGGVILTRFPWGNGSAGPPWMANFWQGAFPEKDDALDGFAGVAPVASFPMNSFGFRDLAGNVAEWCADWYQHDYYAQLRPDPSRAAHRNPQGPDVSSDPTEPGVSKRVVRGGSWLSDEAGCRVASRGREAPDFSADWIGFRCAKDAR